MLAYQKDTANINERIVKSTCAALHQVLQQLAEAGADWIQIDEPILVKPMDDERLHQFNEVYTAFNKEVPTVKLILQTYFESIERYEDIVQLPVAGNWP